MKVEGGVGVSVVLEFRNRTGIKIRETRVGVGGWGFGGWYGL